MTTNPQTKQQISYPSEDELVVATIIKVQNYGAFANLDEYPGCEGMIHISEIASKWIRNINDYVKDGQRVVLRVLRVDRERGHIDLSLKSVKAAQRKETLEHFKREQRAKKLIELAAERLKEKEKISEIANSLSEKFDSLFVVLQKSLTEDENAFEGAKIPENWKKELVKIAKENLEIPRVTIKANLELLSKASNGIEVIKGALTKALKTHKGKDTELTLKYLGAPRYRLEITAPNYKIAEQTLDKFSKEVMAEVTKAQGSAKLVR
ncbi:TPA: translation initiation factor IF-2 subunit alpha [archaeon]|uniref:Translation initiation factor 2 subunit alpha n=1 Tax=Candidatus Naiadarchaeum limnaeum TaxID=2756139 RepID=A0A832XLJ3_9ARCH|nr:translation initiation factor IF-2 subunit alpha [Candidatus Naiadarchaeales archaeon SRR2090153.bin1042]HIJ99962.1 translation initiation factor IF-2 subunit alpha [Candidatus Naiadarchaeum limnaeum]